MDESGLLQTRGTLGPIMNDAPQLTVAMVGLNLENLLDSIVTNLLADELQGSLKNRHMVDSWMQNQKGGGFEN